MTKIRLEWNKNYNKREITFREKNTFLRTKVEVSKTNFKLNVPIQNLILFLIFIAKFLQVLFIQSPISVPRL